MISFHRATVVLLFCTATMMAASCGHETSSASATGAASSPAARSSPSADPRLPEGTYRTGTITLDQLIATGVAAGFNAAAVEKLFREHDGVSVSVAYTIKLKSGRWSAFEAVNGRPDKIGWAGTYQIIDDDTVIAKEIALPCELTFTYHLNGGELRLTVVSNTCGGVTASEEDQILLNTAFQAAPFSKVD
jgi:hypothetical protein